MKHFWFFHATFPTGYLSNANKNKTVIFLFRLQSDIKVVNLSWSQTLSKACVYFHDTVYLWCLASWDNSVVCQTRDVLSRYHEHFCCRDMLTQCFGVDEDNMMGPLRLRNKMSVLMLILVPLVPPNTISWSLQGGTAQMRSATEMLKTNQTLFWVWEGFHFVIVELEIKR